MLGRTVAFGLSFVLPLLLVRRLDQTEYGLYKQIYLIIGTGTNALPLGFHMSAFYFLPRERTRQGQVVLNILLFHALVMATACLTLVLWPWLLGSILGSSDLVPLGPLIGVLLLVFGTSSSLEYIAIANEETRLATKFIIFIQLTRTTVLLIAATIFGTIYSLVLASILQGALILIILLAYLHVRFRALSWRFDWGLMRMQLSYALPLGFAGLLWSAQFDLPSYFVSNRFNPADYAVFAVGVFQLPLIWMLSDSVGAVSIPRVSNLQKEGRHDEIVRVMAGMIRALAAAYLPIYVFLLVASREFITVLFTERYLDSWPVFALNLTMIPLGIIASAYDPVMRSYARERYFFLRVRAILVVALFTALWLTAGRFGLFGVVVIAVGANVAERLVVGCAAARIVNASWADLRLLKDVGKLACAAAVAGLAAAIVRASVMTAPTGAVLIIEAVAFAVAYVVSAQVLRILTQREREMLRERLAVVLRWSPS